MAAHSSVYEALDIQIVHCFPSSSSCAGIALPSQIPWLPPEDGQPSFQNGESLILEELRSAHPLVRSLRSFRFTARSFQEAENQEARA